MKDFEDLDDVYKNCIEIMWKVVGFTIIIGLTVLFIAGICYS